MPNYTYVCKSCNVVVIEYRSVDSRDKLPTTSCVCKVTDYKRVIDISPTATRGDNWGRKGSW
jgi:hypothetical protein